MQIVRHHLLHELPCLLIDPGLIDEDLGDVRAHVVPNRPYDDIALLIDQERGRALLSGLLDGVPEVDQIIQVPLQLFDALADTCGSDDQPHVIRDDQLAEDLAKLVTGLPLYSSGNPPGARVVGHENQIAPGQTDEGGQRGPLVAALFLVHLDDQLLPFLQHILDLNPPAAFRGGGEVTAGNLFQWKETVPLGAVIDERSLQAGFDTGDFPLVDVGFLLFASGGLDIQIIETLAIHQRHTQLFWLSCVEQHSLHACFSQHAPRSPKKSREHCAKALAP